MLATRIIPTMLGKNGALVKGRGYNAWRSVGSILQAARIYATRGVDELCYLDIAATPDGREPDYELVEQLVDKMFVPISIGGGIKTVEHVRELLARGADKVVLGSAARTNPKLITQIADKFGSQAVTVSVDVPAGEKAYAIAMAVGAETAGAGEILLNAMDRDGTMDGYRLDLIKAVAESVDIPVIASGGCRDYDDMHEAIKAGASAIAAGALFQFTDCTPKEAAQYLQGKGVEMRV